jgi:hypothetical protein
MIHANSESEFELLLFEYKEANELDENKFRSNLQRIYGIPFACLATTKLPIKLRLFGETKSNFQFFVLFSFRLLFVSRLFGLTTTTASGLVHSTIEGFAFNRENWSALVSTPLDLAIWVRLRAISIFVVCFTLQQQMINEIIYLF